MFNIKKTFRKLFYKFYAIRQDFIKNCPVFDSKIWDKQTGEHALSIAGFTSSSTSTNENNIAFLATEIYEMGGHSELLKNLIQVLPKEYNSKLFLTKKTKSYQNAPRKIYEIEKYTDITGVDFYIKNEKKLLNKLFGKILEFSPDTLIAFIHMDDTFAVGLLALLKKYTQTKIIYCNHCSHASSLGMSYAHLIWEGMKSTAFVTQKYRGFKNTKVLGLCYLTKDNMPTFSKQEITAAKKEMGIPENAMCTMTGCTSYKLFENDKSSYLEMIKKILIKNENLYHVLITKLNKQQKNILDEMKMPDRFILTDFKPNFKLYFKCADVFVDSIPFSSALTMVDLMSLNIPFAAFKNKENLTSSFYEYFPENYDYLFDNISDMQTGIEKLLNDKNEQNRIAQANYKHFLENFEGSIVAKRILEANSFDPEFDGNEYSDFKEIKLLTFGK